MVKVDVRDDDPAKVCGPEPSARGLRDRWNARLRTGLDQRGHRSIDEESRGELVHPAEQGVELSYPGGDLDGVAHSSLGLRLWSGSRRRPRLLPQQGLQRLQILLHLGLVDAVQRVVARHERCLRSGVVDHDLIVDRDDLLLQRSARCWRGVVPGLGDGSVIRKASATATECRCRYRFL